MKKSIRIQCDLSEGPSSVQFDSVSNIPGTFKMPLERSMESNRYPVPRISLNPPKDSRVKFNENSSVQIIDAVEEDSDENQPTTRRELI